MYPERAFVTIDQNALINNFRCLNNTLKAQVMALLKGDAYGHGLVQIAKALNEDCQLFGVATIEEAISLYSIVKPEATIVIMSGFYAEAHVPLIERYGFQPVIHNENQLQLLQALSKDSRQKLNIWLKFDTGMHRLGFNIDDASSIKKKLMNLNINMTNVTVMTHLACASKNDEAFTRYQYDRFAHLYGVFDTSAFSISNSADIIKARAVPCHTVVRPGLMMYGLTPFNHKTNWARRLRPVMTFKARIIALKWIEKGDYVGYGGRWQARKRSRIAIIAAGYGDGYPQQTPDGTKVMVNDQLAYLAGQVSMDMLAVDVTKIDTVKVGDYAVLWGESITVSYVASQSSMSVYALVTGVSSRVERYIV